MGYSARVVAKWFIAWAEEAEEATISNLKLQKLLYYAQGHYLATYRRPLFDDPIQAWSHGPVVRTVYREYRDFGAGEISIDLDDFDWSEVSAEDTDFLIKVWNTYGGFAAWRLRNMTHEETPWKQHFVDGRNNEIPQSRLGEFFANRTTI